MKFVSADTIHKEPIRYEFEYVYPQDRNEMTICKFDCVYYFGKGNNPLIAIANRRIDDLPWKNLVEFIHHAQSLSRMIPARLSSHRKGK